MSTNNYAEAVTTANDSKPKDLNAVVMHEIRNVHGAILLALQQIAASQDAGQSMLIAQSALPAVQHMGNLIDSGLDLTSLQAGKFELSTTRVDALLSFAVDMLRARAEQKHLSVKTRVSYQLPETIATDVTKVRQVLLNLLTNAIKFTPDGGSILVIAQPDTGGTLQFSVINSGAGMPEEIRAKLFTAFTQAEGVSAQNGGTGLGLFISKLIVEGLHGSIGVTSVEGESSTFYFQLPLIAAPAEQPVLTPIATSQSDGADVSADRRVLIVEDNETISLLAKTVLTADGYRCTVASDGAQGLRLATREPFDFILVDLTLPSMDGLDVIHNIRRYEAEHGGYATIIAMSGYGPDVDMAEADLFLAKPFGIPALRDALKRPAVLLARTA